MLFFSTEMMGGSKAGDTTLVYSLTENFLFHCWYTRYLGVSCLPECCKPPFLLVPLGKWWITAILQTNSEQQIPLPVEDSFCEKIRLLYLTIILHILQTDIKNFPFYTFNNQILVYNQRIFRHLRRSRDMSSSLNPKTGSGEILTNCQGQACDPFHPEGVSIHI